MLAWLWVNVKASAIKKKVLVVAALLAGATVTTGCVGIGTSKSKLPSPGQDNWLI